MLALEFVTEKHPRSDVFPFEALPVVLRIPKSIESNVAVKVTDLVLSQVPSLLILPICIRVFHFSIVTIGAIVNWRNGI